MKKYVNMQHNHEVKNNISVRFVRITDLFWLKREDEHIDPQQLLRKTLHREYLIALLKRKKVGALRFGYLWSTFPFIEVIWVNEEFQRMGIGRNMVEFFSSHLKVRDISMLISSSDSPSAQVWHKKLGFLKIGHITIPDVQDEKEIFFYRPL